ncbi:tyrosine-protein phosphatase non-receptor type substrate 1-like [Rhineura floridana]|uniref:tyrosine-protein phosphatase non-receptor type substrate 1-like n=1 Tax=Rhineura floridana TaxID=261503 RepID=UPI002AC83F0B|nr:tyrosine-protein phosphatase non-receptor type substrate 1-like [Rhineura floridana]
MPKFLSASVGESITLSCTLVTQLLFLSTIKWYKEPQTLVYEGTGTNYRAKRVNPGSQTDFSILIPNIQRQDAGTYFCTLEFLVLKNNGKGTVVSVIGFPDSSVSVYWYKKERRVSASECRVLPEKGYDSYEVLSSAKVLLSEKDVNSQLVCWIRHSSLQNPLRQAFSLGTALRVPPKVWLKMDPPSPVQLNATVTITCTAEGFYPNDTTLAWLENGKETYLEASVLMNQNQDGTFSLSSSLEVTATNQRNSDVFTCRVVHNSQPSVSRSAALNIINSSSEPGQQHLFSSCALWIGLILSKIVGSFFLLYLFLRK